MTQRQVITRSKLGEMALDAAISVEHAQHNSAASMDDLEEFIAAISTQFESLEKGSLRDETMFPYYSFALSRSFEGDEPIRSRFPELISRMLSKRQITGKETPELEQMKQFCLAFHEAMVKAVQSGRPNKAQQDGRVR